MMEKNSICKDVNISPVEFNIIDVLGIDEKISCKNLANRIGLSLSRSSRIVDGLVEKKIMIRKEDPENRKYKQVYFTVKGQKVKDKIELSKSKCEEKIISKFNSDELEMIRKNMEIMCRILKNDI